MLRNGYVIPDSATPIPEVVGKQRFLWRTLIAFQLSYGLFLVNPVCSDPGRHSIYTGFFNLSMVVHYSTVAWKIGLNNAASCSIVAMLAVAIVSIGFGFTYSALHPYDRWTFFITECLGLSVGFGIAPLMAIFSACMEANPHTRPLLQ